MASTTQGYGQQGPSDSSSEFNKISFLVSQMMARLRTTIPVQVTAVTNDGGVSPSGSVDVLPLVTQLDGQGNATPYAEIFGVPYFRLQGGANAIIIDPKAGDIGFMVVADRDISAVKANKAQANPGSYRKFDLADGIYVGGILNGAPTQYVQFSDDGLTVSSGVQVTIKAPVILLQGSLQIDGTATGLSGGTINIGATLNQTAGNIVTTGDVTASGKSLVSHVHSGVQTGGSDTGPPV